MKLTTVFLALLVAGGANAQTAPATESNTSAVKQSEVAPRAEKKDIDEEITNAKLRASTGAKSKISLSSSFNYSGGAITNITSTERPQLNAGQASADPTNLTGQIAVKYRATDHDNLSLGLGLQYTPSYISDRNTGEKAPAATSASTPYLDYSRVFRADDVQHVLSATFSKYTFKSDLEESGLNSELSLSHTFMTSIGTSRFEIGNATGLDREFYSREVPGGTLTSFSLNPILEYAFTDKASFRTVYRMLTLRAKNGTEDTWKAADQTQSMGFGYAITRDVYVYPNMQWKWKALASDQTTFGFSTNINL